VGVAFRWIKFPDLTGDGSFTLGGVVTARLVWLGVPIGLAMPVAAIGGFVAGLCTYAMYRYLRVPKILAGVLTTMALYTVNLRVLGKPNLELPRDRGLLGLLPQATGYIWSLYSLLAMLAVMAFAVVLLYVYLESRSGLLLRVAGANPKMAVAQGIGPNRMFWGLGLSNALVALSGSLIAQRSYNADIHMGTGQVIVAVAALFVGMVMFRKPTAAHLVAAGLGGSFLYMLLMQLALEVGVQAQDFRLISTLVVLVAILIGMKRGGGDPLRRGVDAFGIEG